MVNVHVRGKSKMKKIDVNLKLFSGFLAFICINISLFIYYVFKVSIVLERYFLMTIAFSLVIGLIAGNILVDKQTETGEHNFIFAIALISLFILMWIQIYFILK